MEVGSSVASAGDEESPKKKKNQGGRPAGSVNRDYEFTRVTPKRCAKCHHTEFENREITLERNLSGVAPDGLPYNYIRWFKGRCKACGQWNAFVQHGMVDATAEVK